MFIFKLYFLFVDFPHLIQVDFFSLVIVFLDFSLDEALYYISYRIIFFNLKQAI